MKLVKLSLVAAVAAGSFAMLEAKPLEEAIRNVDVSGALRYRYDGVSWQGKGNKGTNAKSQPGSYYGIANNGQNHHFRAFTGVKLDAGDNFKIFGQIMYNNDKNAGSVGLTQTKEALVLKQAYLQYDLGDTGLSAILGKQQLNTIWTADFTGMAAKFLFTPTQGLTVAGFAVDSFEGSEGDFDALALDDYGIYKYNMYGAAVLANIAGLDAQFWGAHWDQLATLYAANLKYTLSFGGKDGVGVKVTYLGNTPTGYLEKLLRVENETGQATSGEKIGSGNLVDGRLFVNVAGLDAKVGGLFYGKKDRVTVNTLEDTTGPDLYIGREMFYAYNTALVQSFGQNTFGYIGIGYTLPMDLRIGVQGVYGQNKSQEYDFANNKAGEELKDTRWEGVFELSYKVNRHLGFEAWYSYLNSDYDKEGGTEGNKQTVRFQALYKF